MYFIYRIFYPNFFTLLTDLLAVIQGNKIIFHIFQITNCFYFLKGSHKKESRKFSGIRVTTLLRPSCLTRATTSYLWKRRKNISCAKNIYFSAGGGGRKKWIRFMAKTNTTLLELVEKTVVKIEMLAIFICNLIMQLTFWEKVLELFRRGKICVSFHKISD